MSGRVGLRIVGYERQGSLYANIIAYGQVPGMLLTAVTNVHRERRQADLRANPDNEVFDDHVAMPDSGTVDAVVACVPPTTIRRWASRR